MSGTVNEKVINSITQINTETVGLSPSIAIGNLYQATSQALGMAFTNLSNAQQNGNHVGEAIGSTGSKLILKLAT